jgi:serine/threonine-protein kinase RsbW
VRTGIVHPAANEDSRIVHPAWNAAGTGRRFSRLIRLLPVTHTAQLDCVARRDNLATMMRFIDEACARADLGADDTSSVRVAVEELCENIIRYAYAGREPGPLSIRFTSSDERVEVTIEDGGIPFNPSQLPPADVTSEWNARPLGGLGWHLVYRVMDDVRYERAPGGGNRVTLVKRRFATT